jgi:hypothetical protein
METPKISEKTNEIARFGWKISCMTRCKAFLVQNINECGKMSLHHNTFCGQNRRLFLTMKNLSLISML